MRFYVMLCTLAAFFMLLIPAVVLIEPQKPSDDAPKAVQEYPDTVTVFLTDSEKAVTMDMDEYLVGAIAAEMPASYHPQALMAQAAACHTYALYRKNQEAQSPSADLHGADLSSEPQKHQGYLTKEEREEKWGDAFEANEKKIRAAVQAAGSEIMLYEGEPICAAFFAISPGQTETALTAFGQSLPYLQSVACDADVLSPECEKSVVYTDEEFRQAAESGLQIELPDSANDWIGETKTTDSGYVLTICVGGTDVTGSAFRKAFSLRSPVFSITRTDSGFRIVTKGYGHLVGMSQYGADAMARSGADHKQILRHFYRGITISDG